MANTVVILSSHSLFAEGVANRLRQFPQQVNVHVLVPNPDSLSEIQNLRANTVILDANDTETMQLCPLSELMFVLPDLKILRLDSQQQQIQVVSSERHEVDVVRDLIQIISSGSEHSHSTQ